ncbi:hypothetical protein CMV_005883 [Castanea mollissima]|uniref:Uncharacterized protein n=1 Tax=Castanea mollissima TaxID=60419 RepID=A0A8J4RIA4_9ROSI|nr:hypothetical protein CMV_005883 [Castanea mollissima]
MPHDDYKDKMVDYDCGSDGHKSKINCYLTSTRDDGENSRICRVRSNKKEYQLNGLLWVWNEEFYFSRDCWKWVRCETNYGRVGLGGKEVAGALAGLSGFGFGFVFETVFDELERTVTSDVAPRQQPPRHYRDTPKWAPSKVKPRELNSPQPNPSSIMDWAYRELLSNLQPMGLPGPQSSTHYWDGSTNRVFHGRAEHIPVKEPAATVPIPIAYPIPVEETKPEEFDTKMVVRKKMTTDHFLPKGRSAPQQ